MTELDTSGVTKEVLEFRRCIVIAVVGSTPVESASVRAVLDGGYLDHVKTWYDQILHGKVGKIEQQRTLSSSCSSYKSQPSPFWPSRDTGGVDLLLHLLTNIKDLPVTKSLVKQSGMGKAIGSIEKHPICANTPNQQAIVDRVQQIKTAWNASVKARKDKVSRL